MKQNTKWMTCRICQLFISLLSWLCLLSTTIITLANWKLFSFVHMQLKLSVSETETTTWPLEPSERKSPSAHFWTLMEVFESCFNLFMPVDTLPGHSFYIGHFLLSDLIWGYLLMLWLLFVTLLWPSLTLVIYVYALLVLEVFQWKQKFTEHT